jgi:hypothetical protein
VRRRSMEFSEIHIHDRGYRRAVMGEIAALSPHPTTNEPQHLQSTISRFSSSQSPHSILSHTFSYNPTNPTIAGVSGISKRFVVVGF